VLRQEFRPYLACSPVTEVPALSNSNYTLPVAHGG
jgi:hypothetical protein